MFRGAAIFPAAIPEPRLKKPLLAAPDRWTPALSMRIGAGVDAFRQIRTVLDTMTTIL